MFVGDCILFVHLVVSVRLVVPPIPTIPRTKSLAVIMLARCVFLKLPSLTAQDMSPCRWETREVDPCVIRFSQAECSARFRSGTSLAAAWQALIAGDLIVHSFPPINVLPHTDGCSLWTTVDLCSGDLWASFGACAECHAWS